MVRLENTNSRKQRLPSVSHSGPSPLKSVLKRFLANKQKDCKDGRYVIETSRAKVCENGIEALRSAIQSKFHSDLACRMNVSYTCLHALDFPLSFRRYLLQWLRTMEEVVRVSLWYDPPLIMLLNEIFVTLFLCETDRIILALEIQMGALQIIGR